MLSKFGKTSVQHRGCTIVLKAACSSMLWQSLLFYPSFLYVVPNYGNVSNNETAWLTVAVPWQAIISNGTKWKTVRLSNKCLLSKIVVHNLCFWLIKAGFSCASPVQPHTTRDVHLPPEKPFHNQEINKKNNIFCGCKRLCWAVHKSIALKRELVISLSPERKWNRNWQNKVRQLTMFS